MLLRLFIIGAMLYGSYTHFFDDSKEKGESSTEVKIVKEYYDSSKSILKSECEVVDKKRDGVCFFYDKEKNMIRRADYKNDKKDGDEIAFYTSGKIRYIGTYRLNKANGEFNFYKENGHKEKTENYQNGQLNGWTIIFYRDNRTFARLMFDNDNLSYAECGNGKNWFRSELQDYVDTDGRRLPEKCYY